MNNHGLEEWVGRSNKTKWIGRGRVWGWVGILVRAVLNLGKWLDR